MCKKIVQWLSLNTTKIMAVLALVIPTLLSVFLKNPTYGVIALASILSAMLILRFDTIKNLKVMGVLTAELEQKIQQAEVTLRQVKEISLASSKATLAELISSQFMVGLQFDERLEIKNRVVQSLQSLHVSEEERAEVESEWRLGCRFLFYTVIKQKIEDLGYRRAFIEAKALMKNTDKWESTPTASELRTIIENYKLDKRSQALKELLKDYEHFERTAEIPNTKHFRLDHLQDR